MKEIIKINTTLSITNDSNPRVLVIGSGISGLSTAINLASKRVNVILASPYVSERSQSVMAAGGINGAEPWDILAFADDTFKGGCEIEDIETLKKFSSRSKEVIDFLDKIGVVFSVDKDGELSKRFLGGHTSKRTFFSGASTGKQIVTALNRRARYYEAQGLIERKLRLNFLHALIKDEKCYGAIMYNSYTHKNETIYADVLVMATGGQNLIFGKTTGSVICNGAAVGHLLRQGVKLRNLEFVQYHPTSIETPGKKLLITEAARGEGGRLFYYENDPDKEMSEAPIKPAGRPAKAHAQEDANRGRKIYFMENKYGDGKDGALNGNLMPRSITSREIYNVKKQVYLDITHLDKKVIDEKLSEVKDICKTYIDLDVTKEPIPVTPAVHFFMGGIEVDDNHKTSIESLYAVGECASKYHGANRLGGNSLLAAVYSGMIAAEDIERSFAKNNANENVREESASCELKSVKENLDATFADEINHYNELITQSAKSKSKFPAVFLWRDLGEIMNKYLGIVRSEENLKQGIKDIEFYDEVIKKISLDSTLSIYDTVCLPDMFLLAKAIIVSALNRRESRGAHIREDFPKSNEEFKKPQVVSYTDGELKTEF